MTEQLTEQESINTRNGILGLREDMNLIKSSMQEVHTALLGSPITMDGGLVKRIVENEVRVEKLTIRIIEIEKREGNHQITTTIMWSIGGAILLALITALVTHFVNN